MEYKLAEELKDAGFPQDEDGYGKGQWLYTAKAATNGAYAPTLEELIEVCGEDINRILRWANTWGAYSDTKELHGIGSTPTEAVAYLYLALNKNEPPKPPLNR